MKSGSENQFVMGIHPNWIEYAIDSAKLVKNNSLYTVFVTNGYVALEALDAIG
ncbi:MAG: hypothetical protein SCALA701_27270 [Candidatus Scalindua sp.]|nr:MAG: hypothetical protein SCALA701_27270 [Candidatus Scalindua sp.]